MFSRAKRNGRLWVIDGDGHPIYTPPRFIEVRSRRDFDGILADLNAGVPRIEAVTRFETAMRAAEIDRLIEEAPAVMAALMD